MAKATTEYRIDIVDALTDEIFDHLAGKDMTPVLKRFTGSREVAYVIDEDKNGLFGTVDIQTSDGDQEFEFTVKVTARKVR